MKHWIATLLLAAFAVATSHADNGRGQPQKQGQGQGQGQGPAQVKGPPGGQGADKANHGQVVSDCNHRANERNLKGDDRKDFVEWCTSRGARYAYDDNRYSRERDCYRKADKKDLAGDKRQKFLAKCFDGDDGQKDGDGKDKQYHPKVSGAVENSQRK